MAPRRARVLIVDDDAKFGKLMGRALAPEHDILALTSAGEALDRIARGERFDVILCDLMLPGMTGVDLHERVSSIAPELVERVIIITGAAFTPRAEAFLEQAAIARLEKPFSLDLLRFVVREHLRQGAADGKR